MGNRRGARVVNELQVIDTSSIKDLTASATMRGKMIADKDISSLNFSIDVVNGIVYLSVWPLHRRDEQLGAMLKTFGCTRSGELHYSCKDQRYLRPHTLSFAIRWTLSRVSILLATRICAGAGSAIAQP